MYHTIIRHQLRLVFPHLHEKNDEPILKSLAPTCEHPFYGDHALGGTRRELSATRRWYDRLRHPLPDLHFEIRHIAVSGWPWNTLAAVEWRDSGMTLDGHSFNNQGVHFITIRWGRVTGVRMYCDTMILSDCLQRNASQGIRVALSLQHKDFRLILSEADEVSVSMPATAAAQQMYTAALAKGMDEDFSIMIKFMKELAGVSEEEHTSIP